MTGFLARPIAQMETEAGKSALAETTPAGAPGLIRSRPSPPLRLGPVPDAPAD